MSDGQSPVAEGAARREKGLVDWWISGWIDDGRKEKARPHPPSPGRSDGTGPGPERGARAAAHWSLLWSTVCYTIWREIHHEPERDSL